MWNEIFTKSFRPTVHKCGANLSYPTSRPSWNTYDPYVPFFVRVPGVLVLWVAPVYDDVSLLQQRDQLVDEWVHGGPCLHQYHHTPEWMTSPLKWINDKSALPHVYKEWMASLSSPTWNKEWMTSLSSPTWIKKNKWQARLHWRRKSGTKNEWQARLHPRGKKNEWLVRPHPRGKKNEWKVNLQPRRKEWMTSPF